MKRKSIAVVLLVALTVSACNAATVQAYINLAIQIALQVAQLAGVAPTYAQKVSTDLAAAETVYNDLRTSDLSAKPGLASQADAMFTAAENDLQLIFTTANIADPKLQTDVRAGLAIAITAIESARAIALANAPSPVVTALKTTAREVPIVGNTVPRGMNPKQLKSLYNHTMAQHPSAQLK